MTSHTISLDNLQDNWLLTPSYACRFYWDSCCHITPHTIPLDNLQDNWLLTPSYACRFYQDSCYSTYHFTGQLPGQLVVNTQLGMLVLSGLLLSCHSTYHFTQQLTEQLVVNTQLCMLVLSGLMLSCDCEDPSVKFSSSSWRPMHGGNTWNTHDPTHITEQCPGKRPFQRSSLFKEAAASPQPLACLSLGYALPSLLNMLMKRGREV